MKTVQIGIQLVIAQIGFATIWIIIVNSLIPLILS